MDRAETGPRFETETDFTIRIPTRDGTVLGATFTRPRERGSFPALVWLDPYRGAWDGGVSRAARYFAARGYVFVNLHARGTGNSEGLSTDEYMAAETRDGYDAIEWLAAQPWCSGTVGMLGSSYSGFTAVQVAALTPPSLKAIAPAYFTDRRYTDDCHYKGGCLRGYYDTLTYGLNMVARNALPPHPDAVGAEWARLWDERLDGHEPYLLKWLQHPVEDDYWRHGSVIGQYDRIQAAAFLIGGWHDGYPNPPLRTYRALTCPKKLLMGPWSHAYPDVSHCGPRIRINHELVRWWDRWLKGIPNGVDEEPPVQVFVQEFEQPRRDRQAIAGRWHCAAELPPEEASRAFFAGSGSLANEPSDASGSETFDYRPGSAQNGIIWDGGIPFCQAGDQRADEAHAINYTSEPLTEDMVVFGQARVELTVSADVPVLPLACRISEVAPDGTSVLTARGILNLTRREGMDHAVAVRPGEPMRIALDLEANAWRFRAGHRIRLTLDGSDFPNVWPTPCSGSGTVIRSAELPAVLSLPVWHAPEPLPFEFLPSDAPANNPHGSGDPPAWRVVHDVLEDRYHFLTAAGNEFSVSDQDPARAYTRAKSVATASWPGMNIRAEATAALNSDPRSFHLVLSLSVYVNDTLHAQRDWRQSVERHLM